jgi:hypothetical protein
MTESSVTLYRLAHNALHRPSHTSVLDAFETKWREAVDHVRRETAMDWGTLEFNDPEYDTLQRYVATNRHRDPKSAMITYELVMDCIMANMKRSVLLAKYKQQFLDKHIKDIQTTFDEIRNNRVHLPYTYERDPFFVRLKNNQQVYILSFANLAFDSRFNAEFKMVHHAQLANHLVKRLFRHFMRPYTQLKNG